MLVINKSVKIINYLSPMLLCREQTPIFRDMRPIHGRNNLQQTETNDVH